jgi:hypothetical protein
VRSLRLWARPFYSVLRNSRDFLLREAEPLTANTSCPEASMKLPLICRLSMYNSFKTQLTRTASLQCVQSGQRKIRVTDFHKLR